MKLDTLQKLYVEQLQDLYSAEKQLEEGLKKMASKASHPELKQAFEMHLEETKSQRQRLEQLFEKIGEKPGSETCKAMEGLLEEAQSFMRKRAQPDVMDAGLIAMAQRVEHYEIAGYGTVTSYAELMGRKEDQRILSGILRQEKATDKKLTEIAERVVNVDAME